MTATRDRFVMVRYDQIARDPRFDTIRDDDRRMGMWLRLLELADQTWPQPAPLPAGLHRPTIQALLDAGLVEMAPNHYFRLHGLDRERERRAAKGKPGADKRWTKDADANADANASPNADANSMPFAETLALRDRDRDRKGDGSRNRDRNREGDGQSLSQREPALDAYAAFYVHPSKAALGWLDRLIAEYGQEDTARAIGESGKVGRDDLLKRAQSILALRHRSRPEAPESPRETPEQRKSRLREAVGLGALSPEEYQQDTGEPYLRVAEDLA